MIISTRSSFADPLLPHWVFPQEYIQIDFEEKTARSRGERGLSAIESNKKLTAYSLRAFIIPSLLYSSACPACLNVHERREMRKEKFYIHFCTYI